MVFATLKNLNEILQLSKEDQLNLVTDQWKYAHISEEVENYIINNTDLLTHIKNHALYNNKSFFKEIPEKIQNAIITKYIEEIKKLGDNTKLYIWSEMKNQSFQDYLQEMLNIKEILNLTNTNNILYYVQKIKNIESFQKLYKDQEFFNHLMKKSKLGIGDITTYMYSNITKCPTEIQEYILYDLSTKKEYQEQYQEFLKNVSPDIKIKFLKEIPNDLPSLVTYYKYNPTEKIKSTMLNNITFITPSDTIEELLNLYPSLLTILDLNKIIDNANITTIIEKITNEKNETLKSDTKIINIIETKLLATPIIKSYQIYDILKLNLNKNSMFKILDKVENKLELTNHLKNEIIYEYIKEQLKKDPKIFINSNNSNINSIYLISIDKEKGEYLYDYLPPEIGIQLLQNESLDFILPKLKENPSLAQHLTSTLGTKVINSIEPTSPIFDYITLDTLINYINWSFSSNKYDNDSITNIIIKNLNKEKNLPWGFDDFYKTLNPDKKNQIIKNIRKNNLFSLHQIEQDKDIKNQIMNLIIQNQNEIFKNYSYETYKSINNLTQNELTALTNGLSNNNILNIYNELHITFLEELIFQKFNQNNYIFNDHPEAEEIFENLYQSHKESIKETLNIKLKETLKENEDLLNKIIKNDTLSNFKFIECYNTGLLNDPKIMNKFNTLIDNNPYLISTLNFKLLDHEFININQHFIEKVSKYPEIQERIINIKENTPQKFEILKQIMNKTCNDQNKIFDRKLMILLNAFENNEYHFDHNLTEKEIDNLTRYILLSSNVFQFSKNSMNISNINPLNYDNEIANICDLKFEITYDPTEIKNVLFQKYFDITYDDALEFLRMYDNDKNNVDINPHVAQFLENIKDITSINNVEMLRELYNTYSPRYTINDMFEVENSLQQSYNKELENSMFKGNGDKIELEINGQKIQAINLNKPFKMLTHSTNAYSSMPMIDNDYYKSWNLSKKMNNHGICTALVSEKCLGLPPLRNEGDGCIFGFTEFSEDSITNMAPYDLCSINNEYELQTSRPLIYTSSEDIINTTRHSHNEYVLERTNLKNNDTVNIQPQYIIITSEMTEHQKENSLKAANEMNPPTGLPIVYIGIKEIVKTNQKNILDMMSEFGKTKNPKTLKNLINDYETVKCTLRTIQNYEFINVDIIDNLITSYINYCNTLPEIEKNIHLESLEIILNDEKRKFDLIIDSGNRFKEFDIDYKKHIEQIMTIKKQYDNLTIENNKTL